MPKYLNNGGPEGKSDAAIDRLRSHADPGTLLCHVRSTLHGAFYLDTPSCNPLAVTCLDLKLDPNEFSFRSVLAVLIYSREYHPITR